MSDKATPGSNVSRGDIDVTNRVTGEGGVEISPDTMREDNSGVMAWPDGVETVGPKAPRS